MKFRADQLLQKSQLRHVKGGDDIVIIDTVVQKDGGDSGDGNP